MCIKKNKFSSEKYALEYIKKYNKTCVNKIDLHPYLCPECMTWHITKSKQTFANKGNLHVRIIQLENQVKMLKQNNYLLKQYVGQLERNMKPQLLLPQYCQERSIYPSHEFIKKL